MPARQVLARQDQWPAKNAAKAIASPATRPAAAVTVALAASTARRRGTAANVVRIMPVACSEVIASAPKTPKASWTTSNPARLIWTGSKVVQSMWLVLTVAAEKTATVTATAADPSST